MSFDTEFIAEAWPDLKELHGESVTYNPRAGGARVITAIVNRNPPAPVGTPDGLVLPRMIVTVENDDTSGISSATIDCSGDTITLAERSGGTAEEHPISRLANDDGGLVTVWI